MDKKILSGKTVKELRSIAESNSLKIESGSKKDDIVELLVRHEQKQKRLAKKANQPDANTVPKSASWCSARKSTSKTAPTSSATTPTPKSTKKSVTVKEDVKKTADGKYTIIQQLGSTGKEGTTFLVKNRSGNEFAMKVFPKQKSANTLAREGQYQKQVSKFGIAPKIKEVNDEAKYIIMEKLDRNLFDIVKKNNGGIPDAIQRKIVGVITKMDETGVFHGDPNPANFMLRGNEMYMIDYGFARDIDDKLMKKYDTDTPNKKFMILGLILKLKEIYREHNPDIEYKILSKILK